MLALAPLLADKIPDWIPDLLREPAWLGPLTQAVRQFVVDHQTVVRSFSDSGDISV